VVKVYIDGFTTQDTNEASPQTDKHVIILSEQTANSAWAEAHHYGKNRRSFCDHTLAPDFGTSPYKANAGLAQRVRIPPNQNLGRTFL